MPFLTFRDLWRLNGEICRHLGERPFQKLSFAFFGFGVAIIVPEIMTGIPDKTIIFRKIWPLMTSADLNIHLSEKMTEVTSNGLTKSCRSPYRPAF